MFTKTKGASKALKGAAALAASLMIGMVTPGVAMAQGTGYSNNPEVESNERSVANATSGAIPTISDGKIIVHKYLENGNNNLGAANGTELTSAQDTLKEKGLHALSGVRYRLARVQKCAFTQANTDKELKDDGIENCANFVPSTNADLALLQKFQQAYQADPTGKSATINSTTVTSGSYLWKVDSDGNDQTTNDIVVFKIPASSGKVTFENRSSDGWKATGTDGSVTFGSGGDNDAALGNGVYFVAEDLSGNYDVTVKTNGTAGETDRTIKSSTLSQGAPVIVMLPMTNPTYDPAETAAPNNVLWLHTVNVYPKNSDISVKKAVSQDEGRGSGSATVSGATVDNINRYRINAGVPGYAIKRFALVDQLPPELTLLGTDADHGFEVIACDGECKYNAADASTDPNAVNNRVDNDANLDLDRSDTAIERPVALTTTDYNVYKNDVNDGAAGTTNALGSYLVVDFTQAGITKIKKLRAVKPKLNVQLQFKATVAAGAGITLNGGNYKKVITNNVGLVSMAESENTHPLYPTGTANNDPLLKNISASGALVTNAASTTTNLDAVIGKSLASRNPAVTVAGINAPTASVSETRVRFILRKADVKTTDFDAKTSNGLNDAVFQMFQCTDKGAKLLNRDGTVPEENAKPTPMIVSVPGTDSLTPVTDIKTASKTIVVGGQDKTVDGWAEVYGIVTNDTAAGDYVPTPTSTLANGSTDYCLKEIEAPNGYEINPNPIVFKLHSAVSDVENIQNGPVSNEDDLTDAADLAQYVVAKDVPTNADFKLPFTGGKGIIPFIVMGILLVAAAGFWFLAGKRRKDEEENYA